MKEVVFHSNCTHILTGIKISAVTIPESLALIVCQLLKDAFIGYLIPDTYVVLCGAF